MKTICLLLFVMTMVFLVPQARSAEWEWLGDDSFNNKWFVDLNSLKSLSANTFKIWIKMTYSTEGRKEEIRHRINARRTVTGFETLNYNLTLDEFDCTKRARRGMAVVYYSTSGSVLASWYAEPSQRWNPIVPDTLTEYIFESYCEGLTQKQTPKNPEEFWDLFKTK